MTLVLVPQDDGLSTPAVFGELDRLRGTTAGSELDPAPLHALAAGSVAELAAALANDLEPAALALRPDLVGPIEALRAAGALGAQVSGSGPTTFGVFADRAAALRAAERVGAAGSPTIVTGLRA
jgi:4-diphosphocytidyl-2-C-methyl-D-erythritol kinase